LAALGSFLQPQDFFVPLWEYVELGGKTVLHEPHQTLLDVVVSIPTTPCILDIIVTAL
jgi:hypothetical protein